jgi:hypothetical protein
MSANGLIWFIQLQAILDLLIGGKMIDLIGCRLRDIDESEICNDYGNQQYSSQDFHIASFDIVFQQLLLSDMTIEIRTQHNSQLSLILRSYLAKRKWHLY